jgi:NADH-quinone oxidoreductase subunit H
MNWHELFLNFINWPGSQPANIPWWLDLIRVVLRILMNVMIILLVVPPLVWLERRLLGWMQQRQGPNRVGPFGLLQTIADGVKLLLKEDIIPTNVDKGLYIAAPIVMLIPALVTTGVVPWTNSAVWGAAAPNVNVGILYVLAMSSLTVYGVVLAGWSSNNKYALLGGLRSAAQVISYELAMGVAIVSVVLMSGHIDMMGIVHNQIGSPSASIPVVSYLQFLHWHLFQFFPMGFLAMIIYCISGLAETNRAPFDLPEAETELIAGYHIEYTSMKFAMFFMGEYANMVVISAIGATLFFGGFAAPFTGLDNVNYLSHILPQSLITILNAFVGPFWLTLKVFAGLWFFIWVRATLPRLRYDMLMEFGWKGLLPIALGNILCIAIGITYGTAPGIVSWLVIAALGIIFGAQGKSSKAFTTKTRRTVLRYNEAQPYTVVNEAISAAGGSIRPRTVSEPEPIPSLDETKEEQVS